MATGGCRASTRMDVGAENRANREIPGKTHSLSSVFCGICVELLLAAGCTEVVLLPFVLARKFC